MSKKFVAKDCIAALNIFKNALNNSEFTEEQLTIGLKQCKIPSNKVFISELRKSPIITRISKDRYTFSNKEPIYYGILDNVYKGYHKRIKQYKSALNLYSFDKFGYFKINI